MGVSLCKNDDSRMIGDQLLTLFIKEPLSALTDIVGNVSAFKAGCIVCLHLGQGMSVSELRRDNVFADRTDLSRLLGCLCSGSVRNYFALLAASCTAVIMSRRSGMPNSVKAMTERIAVIGVKRVAAGKAGLFRITSFGTSGRYNARRIGVIKLRKRNGIFAVAVDTAVGNVSALQAGRVGLVFDDEVVSGRAHDALIIEAAGRALVFRYAVGHTVVFLNDRSMPFVSERRRFGAFYLLSATDTDRISARDTGRMNGMYVGQIVLVQVLTKLLGRDSRCHVVGEVSRGEGYVSVRVRSGNGGKLSVRNIPDYDIIGVLITKHVRDTYGCRTAKVADVFVGGKREIVYLFIAEKRLLLGGKICAADGVIPFLSLKRSRRDLNIASAFAELILYALVKSDDRIVQRHLVKRADVAARHIGRASACRNGILRSIAFAFRAVIRDHSVDALNGVLYPGMSAFIGIRDLSLGRSVIFTAFILTELKL